MDAETSTRAFRTESRLWLRDFEFGLTGLTVRKTGARVPYNASVLGDVTAWFRFYFAAARVERLGPAFTIAFSPERARPWYLIWQVSRAAGGKAIQDVSRADIVVHFEDATFSPNPAPINLKPGARLLNFGCRDVSKSHVADIFAQTFGYPLMVDPRAYVGPVVEKSEINAAHDGRIVQCPTDAAGGRCYQRLVDNRTLDPNIVEDFRTSIVGGKPACVFVKRRPVHSRFSNSNCEVLLANVEQAFSTREIALITEFARRLGLEWGGLDILRDRSDGRIYIVDANKTDLGPPIAMGLQDKLRALKVLARAFRENIADRL